MIISGDRACFRRPELVPDWITYDVITPIAARLMFEAVHWTPSMRWWIDEILVLTPIKIEPISFERRMTALVDVRYLVTAHFDLTERAGRHENAGQHSEMFRRRLRRRQFFKAPYLGHRNMPATLLEIGKGQEAPRPPIELSGETDLGWMIYDTSYEDLRPRFFRPTMLNGIIDLRAMQDPLSRTGSALPTA